MTLLVLRTLSVSRETRITSRTYYDAVDVQTETHQNNTSPMKASVLLTTPYDHFGNVIGTSIEDAVAYFATLITVLLVLQ